MTETIASPCTGACAIDSKTGLCAGCFRTLREIAAWPDLAAKEKADILEILARRRARRR